MEHHQLGTQIATLRKRRGMSQEELANQLGVTRQAISNWERGMTQPDLEMLMKLAAIFETDLDGLNYLSGKTIDFVNKKAFQGTLLAHVDGGVPNLIVDVPELSAYSFGYLVYFFEKACAMSGYILGVNPFDQPGVEAYKKNMFALLGKPGNEELKAQLEARLK